MPLDDPRDLPRVPSHLQRHPIIRPQTRREQLDLLRLGLDPPSKANLAILNNRDLTEIQVHIQPDSSHHTLPCTQLNKTGDAWANDTDGSALEAQPDKSQGRPPKS
ncbi:MAG TPA: hypothetical protein VES97_03400, partial [Solirubrobacteraceae bacterium]|nr:hypothetical protein [Solirubrobacteraceae bacterium]